MPSLSGLSPAEAVRSYRPVASSDLRAGIRTQVCAMEYETCGPSGSPLHRLQAFGLGDVGLVRYEGRGPEHAVRTHRHVRIDAADNFILSLPVGASLRIEHVGHRSVVGPGEAVLVTAAKPFDIAVEPSDFRTDFSTTQLRVPGSLLRQRVPAIDRCCNRPILLDTAAGDILRTLLDCTLSRGTGLTESQAPRQGMALVEMVASLVLPQAVSGAIGYRGSHVYLFEVACRFIESRLSDPALDVSLVARHCGVSPRYLHKVFGERSLSIAGMVRDLRLDGCRQALRDSRLEDRSILEIAGNWGFNDPSHFGRIYRKRFGSRPRDDRP